MTKMGGERAPAEYDSWDLSQGRRFEAEILDRFLVHDPFSSPVSSFFVLAVFRCSSFRLMEDSVGMALHFVLETPWVVFISLVRSLATLGSLWPRKQLVSWLLP
jgi:hypothetical protein